jgi:RNA polymerase-binding transcription factor DksA
VTNAVHDHTEQLHRALEEQFEAHTGHLTDMIMRGGHAGAAGPDTAADDVRALSTSSRQALADIANALRRMAEGSYGTCEHCGDAIPVERLDAMPQVRYCAPCQSGAPEARRADPGRRRGASGDRERRRSGRAAGRR